MKIEHLALYVYDLEKAKEFFQKYFGAKANNLYHNPKTNFKSYFLTFDDGPRLEIMTRPEVQTEAERNAPKSLMHNGFIHLAFSAGSKEKVDELTARFKADGYKVLSGPRTTGDGYYESCIQAFEDNQIEITE